MQGVRFTSNAQLQAQALELDVPYTLNLRVYSVEPGYPMNLKQTSAILPPPLRMGWLGAV